MFMTTKSETLDSILQEFWPPLRKLSGERYSALSLLNLRQLWANIKAGFVNPTSEKYGYGDIDVSSILKH